MSLEDIMLSEISHSQKNNYLVIPYIYEVLRTVKSIETERRLVVARAEWEAGSEKLLLNSYRVSVLQDGKSYGDGMHDSINVLNPVELSA